MTAADTTDMLQADLKIPPPTGSPDVIDDASCSDRPPETPKPPFDPPRRRSSLAFSKVVESPQLQDVGKIEPAVTPRTKASTPALQSNIGKKRATIAREMLPNSTPGRATQLHRAFRAARANLHLDMHFAASPGGSIDSRLPFSEQQQSTRGNDEQETSPPKKNWRFSTMSQLFTAAHQDVREPLPSASPILPAAVHQDHDSDPPPIEPTSSGFASPIEDETDVSHEHALLLPSSSPPAVRVDEVMGQGPVSVASLNGGLDELAEPMTELRVTSNQEDLDKVMQDSPTVDHVRRTSRGQYPADEQLADLSGTIFLSQTAKAAAEFAKAKRGIFKQATHNRDDEKENIPLAYQCPDPTAHMAFDLYRPEPGVHHISVAPQCPNPFVHALPDTPDRRHDLEEISHNTCRRGGSNTLSPMSRSRLPLACRTTAAGSPMPFSRRNPTPFDIYASDLSNRQFLAPSLPRQYDSRRSPGLSPLLHQSGNPVELPKPGERRLQEFREPIILRTHAINEFYSFSTAAAKAIGESAAPDQRIRDSYRTDTLTPLVQPLGRYTAAGTTAVPRPSQRSMYRPANGASAKSMSRRAPLKPDRKFRQLHSFENVQSKSSPPRSSARFASNSIPRKRGSEDLDMPDFVIVEDESAESFVSVPRLRPSNRVIGLNSDIGAAEHMPIPRFKSTESTQVGVEEIKELSHNVSIWRKPMLKGIHHRKKRRSSYWDDDLEEVRLSPAGRRGTASSPAISKHSMIAELDSVTVPAEPVGINEDDLVGEVEQASVEFEQRMSGGAENDGVTRSAKLEH